MIFEPADSAEEIAKVIVENARMLTNDIGYGSLNASEKSGYIGLIDTLVATKGNLYNQLQLNDDYRYDAVIAKATSFAQIVRTQESSDDPKRVKEAFNRLEDSYSRMMSYWLYSDNELNF